MNRFLVMAVFYIFLSSIQVIAGQFYQYKDDGGTLIFTDDLSLVPMDQRPEVKQYESLQSQEKALPEEPAKDLKPPLVDPGLGANEKDPNWFNEEGKRLNREKKALLTIKNDINTAEKRSEYNRRVKELNQQIEAYKIKREQFNKGLTP